MLKRLSTMVVLSLLANSTLFADALDQVNNNFGAGLNSGYMTYKESVSGGTLDKERGTLPGLNAHITKTISHLYLNLKGNYYDGDLKYDGGYTNGSGSNVAFTFKNDRQVYNADFQLGVTANAAENVQIIPYLDAGYHQWYRPIPAPPITGGIAYNEKYTNYVGGVGVKVNWQFGDNFVLTPDFMIAKTIKPELNMSLLSQDIDLGSKPLFRLGLTGNYFFSKNWSFYGFVKYEQFTYGRSSNIIVNATPTETDVIFEPNSKSTMTSAGVGVSFIFA